MKGNNTSWLAVKMLSQQTHLTGGGFRGRAGTGSSSPCSCAPQPREDTFPGVQCPKNPSVLRVVYYHSLHTCSSTWPTYQQQGKSEISSILVTGKSSLLLLEFETMGMKSYFFLTLQFIGAHYTNVQYRSAESGSPEREDQKDDMSFTDSSHHPNTA